jgi:hypothetical protein
MARNLALIALALLVALALWLWSSSAPDAVPLASPEPRAARPQALDSAQTEKAPEPKREEAAAPAASPQPGLLLVLCKSKETGAALAGQVVHLCELQPPSGVVPVGKGLHGRLGELLTTDAAGRVEYELAAGVPATLSVHPEKHGANAFARQDIPALAAGERREVVLELGTSEDAHCFLRVLAHESHLPAAWTTVALGERELQGGADGLYDVPYASWGPARVTITAAGFEETWVVAQAGHETPEKALRIELDRACTIVGVLKDASGAQNGAQLHLKVTTESYRLQSKDPQQLANLDIGEHFWTRTFDDSGRAKIDRLSPNAPLRISVLAGNRKLVELAEPLTLQPGESREVELRPASTCKLFGRVRDDTGEPVADILLWLLRAGTTPRLYVASYEGDERVGQAKTDAQGRFEIPKVASGTWRLCPEAKFRMGSAPLAPDAIAPVAMLVEIPAGAEAHEVELVVHRGLSISGKVLDPDGQPVGNGHVGAFAPSMWFSENTAKDGSFVLGPLGPGSYTLEADGYAGEFANSESVQAEAGARDVVLHLRRAGKLSGRVVDGATGEGLVAEIAVGIPGSTTGRIYMPRSTPDGAFAVDGLLPGTYALAAALADGRVGVLRGVEVVGGGDAHDLVIAVQPGARVRVRYEGAKGFCSTRVEQDGVVIATDGVEKGTSKTLSAPAGSVRVVCRLGGNGKEIVRELSLAVGQEQELVIRDQD